MLLSLHTFPARAINPSRTEPEGGEPFLGCDSGQCHPAHPHPASFSLIQQDPSPAAAQGGLVTAGDSTGGALGLPQNKIR